jgi:hypothetical protein
MTLDRMLAKPANQAFLAKALEEELRKNPLRFFRSIIMPLIPHETRTAIEQAGVVGWRSLVSSSITGAGLQSDAGGGVEQVEGGGLKVAIAAKSEQLTVNSG